MPLLSPELKTVTAESLTLWQLRDRLASLPCFDSDDTNICEIKRAGCGLLLVPATESGEIAELKESISDLEAQLKDLEKEADEAVLRAEKAEEILAGVSDPESGENVLELKARADKADQTIREQRAIFDESRRELAALRKRKGVNAGFFKHSREISDFIHACAKQSGPWQLLAQDLVSKLRQP